MRNGKIRILLAGANPYNPNKGVAALAISTIRLLDEVARENNIDVEICVYTHEADRVYDYLQLPDNKVIKFKNIFPSDLFGIKKFFNCLQSKWKLYNLLELYKCDYILNITAGDSFSDIYGIDNFKAVNKINRLAQKLGIKYSFLPQTYGPFYDLNIKKMAIQSLSKADLLLSRDEQSTDYLKEILPAKEVKSLIDVAFYLPYKRCECHIMPGLNVGVNISQTLWDTPADNKINLTCSYREVIYETINNLVAKGYIVHIIPHVVNADNHKENEYFLSYRIWEEFKSPNIKLAPLFLSPMDAKSYISGLDLFIGARMHACIAAFSSGVPVLPMSYSRKFEGLFKSTLGYQYVINLTDLDNANTIEKSIDEIIERKEEIRDWIRHTNETVVAKHLSGIKDSLRIILSKLNK